MKTLNYLTRQTQRFALFAMTLLFSVIAFAQTGEAPADVNITTTETTTTTTEEWITNPLYWVIGALLLIVLIAVIARGNKKD